MKPGRPKGLDLIFNPTSIAIVGASPDRRKISGRPLDFLQRHGFPGDIFPVNPKRTEIDGLRCFQSVSDVPAKPDVALVITPADAAERVVTECAEVGVGAAILFTGGFREFSSAGARTEERMLATASEHGMRLLGPNCQGLVNPAANLCATFNACFLVYPNLEVGPVGWAGQSGAVGGVVFDLLRKAGLSVSSWVSTGNEIDIDVPEVISHQLLDHRTRVVASYIEGIRDVDRFREVTALARSLRKSLVVVKGGNTPAGERATMTHTGTLSGDEQAYRDLMRQEGVNYVSDLNDLVAVITASLGARGPLQGNVAIMGNSGGLNVLLADQCYRLGLNVPEPSAVLEEEIRQLLPGFIQPNNPIDFQWTIFDDPSRVERLVSILDKHDDYDIYFVVLHSLYAPVGYRLDDLLVSLERARAAVRGLFVLVLMNSEASFVTEARSRGFVVFESLDQAVRAAAQLTTDRPRTIGGPIGSMSTAREIRSSTEHEAKRFLANSGLVFPKGKIVTSALEAATAATELGFPVVLKLQAQGLPHKSESGAIALNVGSGEQVSRQFTHLRRMAERQSIPGVQGVLVEKQIEGVVAEAIVGVRGVPGLGFHLTFGLGGTLTELLADTSSRLLPVTKEDVKEMMREIRGYALLTGYRGRPAGDVSALESAISSFAQFVLKHTKEIRELELNPVAVLAPGEGVVVLDALLVKQD